MPTHKNSHKKNKTLEVKKENMMKNTTIKASNVQYRRHSEHCTAKYSV